MGNTLICGAKQKPSPTKTNQSLPIHTSEEIINENIQKQIREVVHECVDSLSEMYQNERERILNEMRRAAPAAYLDLLFSEYPEKNGSIVNEMARRLATSDEARAKLLQQIYEQLDTKNIIHLNAISSSTFRTEVKRFVEQSTDDAIDQLVFPQ